MRIGVLSKGALSDSATQWAQGGVAAVLHHTEADVQHPGDSVALHAADTLAAGAGLCDRAAVEVLVSEGPARVRELAALGAVFDRNDRGRVEARPRRRPLDGPGRPRRRGRHRRRGGTDPRRRRPADRRPHLGGLVRPGPDRGRWPVPGRDRPRPGRDGSVELRAAHTLLATGGAGQLYSVTTNPPQSSGDGLAMALRAGVPGRRRRVRPVPPHRPARLDRRPPPATQRGAAGRGRPAARPARPALRRRAAATRRRGGGGGRPYPRGRRRPRVARRLGRGRTSTAASRPWPRSCGTCGLDPDGTGCRWRRPPTTCAAAS